MEPLVVLMVIFCAALVIVPLLVAFGFLTIGIASISSRVTMRRYRRYHNRNRRSL